MGSIMYSTDCCYSWWFKTFSSSEDLIIFIESHIGKITRFSLDVSQFDVNNGRFKFYCDIRKISQYSDTKSQNIIYKNIYNDLLTEYLFGVDSDFYNKNIL